MCFPSLPSFSSFFSFFPVNRDLSWVAAFAPTHGCVLATHLRAPEAPLRCSSVYGVSRQIQCSAGILFSCVHHRQENFRHLCYGWGKNQEASTSLGTTVSFWKLADLKISLSFCAGHISLGVDDKVSEPNFNWNLFLTSLPVSKVLLLYAS